jgi:hypothetical protein
VGEEERGHRRAPSMLAMAVERAAASAGGRSADEFRNDPDEEEG